jgi:hypothetical protein
MARKAGNGAAAKKGLFADNCFAGKAKAAA